MSKNNRKRYSLMVRSLSAGWHDRDNVLLHSSFQILVDFVEKESPFDIIDWDHDREHQLARKEIKALYRWWKKVRPARKSPLTGVRTPKRYKLSGAHKEEFKNDPAVRAWRKAADRANKLELTWYREDGQMLRRLIDIRQYLWV